MTEKTIVLQENDSAIIFRSVDPSNFKLDAVVPKNGHNSSTIAGVISMLLTSNDFMFRQIIKNRANAIVRKLKKGLQNDKLSIHSK
jgi:hypothetical protein